MTTPENAAVAPEPVLVVRGHPSAAELAALLAVLALRSSADAPPPPASTAGDNGWAAPWRRLRTTPRPGPGVWRRSSWA